MSKHTPGPWKVDSHEMGTFIKCRDGYIITGPINNRSDGECNALLISKAPDMLDMLKRIADGHNGFNVMSYSLVDEIRALIQRAEGGENELRN